MNRKLVNSSIPGTMVYVCTDCGNALGCADAPVDNCDVCDYRRAGGIVLDRLGRLDNDGLIRAFRAIGLTDLEKIVVASLAGFNK